MTKPIWFVYSTNERAGPEYEDYGELAMTTDLLPAAREASDAIAVAASRTRPLSKARNAHRCAYAAMNAVVYLLEGDNEAAATAVKRATEHLK